MNFIDMQMAHTASLTRLLALAVALAVALILKAAAPVLATSCAPLEVITERLAEKYGEHRAYGGLVSETAVMKIRVNGETGTWTVLIIVASGLACVQAVGQIIGAFKKSRKTS